MFKIFLFILFPLFAFSQHIDYETMSDQQLQEQLKKELVNMQARGATPDLIFEKFVIERNAYRMSREAYFRILVHTDYLVDDMLTMKMEKGTDTPSDFEMVKKFKEGKKQKSYQDYVDHTKTDQAIEQWENNTYDGILKLVVDNHEQYSEAEQKRYEGLIILLDRDSYFSRFEITDGKTIKVIFPKREETP